MASMLMLSMLAAFSVGMIYLVQTSMQSQGTDLEGNQVFYGAAAAMEKMVVDLNTLYSGQQVVSVADVEALAGVGYRPALPGVNYSQYQIVVPNTSGVPDVEFRNITAGPNQGLMAFVNPVTLNVTASGTTGGTVSMTRNVEFAMVPVFEFGVFSDSDLSYFPDIDFQMGGRVHTNGNLFLASSSTSGVTFHSRVTAGQEIVRAELANGSAITAFGFSSPIKIPTAPNGCAGTGPACQPLEPNQGSKTAGPGSSDNPQWTHISESDFSGMILNDDTGARVLNLPFTDGGARPIEIIRRPPAGEDPTALLGRARLYNQAQVRVFLSDTAAQLPGGAGVQLTNVAPYYDGVSYGATDTAFAEVVLGGLPQSLLDILELLPESLRNAILEFFQRRGGGGPLMMLLLQGPGGGIPLIDGYLLVQARQADGSYTDVTMEWLNLGVARENADAILKLQSLTDADGDGVAEYANTAANREVAGNFLPLNMYDTREGELRDVVGATDCALGGIMNLVELDAANLRRWLLGAIGTTGSTVENTTQNGYLLYFSDRRGMLPDGTGNIVGEYGFEDVVNAAVANGQPDGNLGPSEDVNGNGVLDTYGAGNLGDGFSVGNGDPTLRISCADARINRVSGARRALKLVNGSLGNLPTRADGSGGFTVASENAVYVQGNYNADTFGFGNPHAPAAVIADSVTFLSGNWGDWRSFLAPTDKTGRPATTTRYRVAVAAGKNKNWAHPTWSAVPGDGLDGGVLHFVRALEEWPAGQTLHYRGSLVSLFSSESAVGVYRCCQSVFSLAAGDYSYDSDFADPSNLPPGSPRFQEIVTLGFRQVFTN